MKAWVPPLNDTLHKGQAGRIAVLGGCQEYTGSPFFAGMTALRLGADLVHIFCDEKASTAIKSYSPEFIVHPYICSANDDVAARSGEMISHWLPRMHSLLIGPGAGRDSAMVHTIQQVIGHVTKISKLNLPLILDADGIHASEYGELVAGYHRGILTPNEVEFQRMCAHHEVDGSSLTAVRQLAEKLGGVIVIRKGKIDQISNGKQDLICDATGSLKRSGGQGDVLSGTVATFAAWASQALAGAYGEEGKDLKEETILLEACQAACHVTKLASFLAFEEHGRSMLAGDVLAQIPKAMKIVENLQ